MMSEIDIQRLRDLLAAATPGVWRAMRTRIDEYEATVVVSSHSPGNIGIAEIVSDEAWVRDGEIIAAAHNAMPDLLDELATLRQQLAGEQAAREAAEAERRLDLQHGAAMEVKYSRLYDATDGLVELLEEATWNVMNESYHKAEKNLRAAAAKLKEAQS